MKKSKVLIGTLALATALMGTGYAYWHQTTTVNATVATADFGVVFDNVDVVKCLANGDKNDGTTNGTELNNYYAEVTKETNAKDGAKPTEITYTWNNIYPGTAAKFTFDIVNESTIPVWARPDVTSTASEAVKDALVWTLKVDDTVKTSEDGSLEACAEALKLELAKADGDASDNDVKKIELIAELPTEVTDSNVIGQSFTFNTTMNWSQFNEAESPSPSETPAPSESPVPTAPSETPSVE